jgi:hypothetical protein
VETLKTFNGRVLEIGPECAAIHMKGLGKSVARALYGVEERDNAIKGGTKGAITLLFERGSLIIPGLSNLFKNRPEEAKMITSTFNLEDGEVILIAFAVDYWRALDGVPFLLLLH